MAEQIQAPNLFVVAHTAVLTSRLMARQGAMQQAFGMLIVAQGIYFCLDMDPEHRRHNFEEICDSVAQLGGLVNETEVL